MVIKHGNGVDSTPLTALDQDGRAVCRFSLYLVLQHPSPPCLRAFEIPRKDPSIVHFR